MSDPESGPSPEPKKHFKSSDEKFIEEFNADFVALRGLKVGTKLVVKESFLGYHDPQGLVVMCHRLAAEDAEPDDDFVLIEDVSVYDPENPTALSDLLDDLHVTDESAADAIRARWKKAELD